jgi:hypothetical protein
MALPTNNVPSEIIHVLASHGPVTVATYAHEGASTVGCAPFEDIIHLFVSPGSATEAALLKSSRMTVSAKAKDGSYQVRMEGRAHAGRILAGHPLLSVLEPWCPEGVPISRLLVVPFIAEHIEFVRGKDEAAKRNAGLTPAGHARPTPGRMWLAAAFSGMAGPLGYWILAWTTIWFGIQGNEFVGRPLGVVLAIVGGLGLVGGIRLFTIAQGFILWRKMRAGEDDAPWLLEGFFSPLDARLVGTAALTAAVAALGSIWMVWGSDLFWLVILGSGAWLCGPAWLIHLALGRPDPRS